jgi:putative transposase
MLSKGGTPVNRKHVQRLMQLMGLEAIYAKRNTSKANPGHKKFPYLLRGLAIDRPDQVWGCDISVPQQAA